MLKRRALPSPERPFRGDFHRLITYGAVFCAAAFPLAAFGQTRIRQILLNVQNIFDLIIELLFAFATVVFLWGMVKFIANAADDKARSAGKQLILWGIIGMAIMASAWGIANIVIEFLAIPRQELNEPRSGGNGGQPNYDFFFEGQEPQDPGGLHQQTYCEQNPTDPSCGL